MKDLYKILGTNKTVKSTEIKQAYFAMAKKYHPDTGSDEEVRKFYEITEAYKILSDKEQRRAYDLAHKTDQVEEPLIQEIFNQSEKEVAREEADPNYAYRQKEIHKFRKSLLIKAYLRVIFFSIMLGITGYIYSIILGESQILGAFFGTVFGFTWSLFKYFDVYSFVKDKKLQRILHGAYNVIIVVSILYFVTALIV